MLQLKQIIKTFPGHFCPILNGVNLKVDAGEFCVMIGSNGSGKSTLLRTIAGEYTPDSGEILIHNQVLHNRKSLISSVIQDVNQGTIPEMSLLENVVLGRLKSLKPRLLPYRRHREDAMQWIASLGMNLERYLHTPLRCLSGGQRQMIAMLMAVQSKPAILLLDEHTSALDPKTQQQLMAYTAKSIKEGGMLALMVTHKLDDAIRYGDRLIMLHNGRVVLDVAGEKKQSLTMGELLDCFHRYEDLSLIAAEGAA